MAKAAVTKAIKPNAPSTKPATRTAPRKTARAKPSSKVKGSPPRTPTPSAAPPTKRQQLADLLTRDAGAGGESQR